MKSRSYVWWHALARVLIREMDLMIEERTEKVIKPGRTMQEKVYDAEAIGRIDKQKKRLERKVRGF